MGFQSMVPRLTALGRSPTMLIGCICGVWNSEESSDVTVWENEVFLGCRAVEVLEALDSAIFRIDWNIVQDGRGLGSQKPQRKKTRLYDGCLHIGSVVYFGMIVKIVLLSS